MHLFKKHQKRKSSPAAKYSARLMYFTAVVAVGLASAPAILQAQSLPPAFQGFVYGANLNGPLGTAVDAKGNIFVTEFGGNRIDEIPADGSPQVALANAPSPLALRFDPHGNLFVNSGGTITKVAADGSTTPISGALGLVWGFYVDAAGDIFAANPAAGTVTEYPVNGGNPVPIATGQAPFDVVVDSQNNVYFTDQDAGTVMKVRAGGSPVAIASNLSGPSGLDLDKNGNLFVSTLGGELLEIAADGTQTILSNAASTHFLAINASDDVYYAGQYSVLVLPHTGATFGNVQACAAGQTNPGLCSKTLTLSYMLSGLSNTLGGAAALSQGAANLDFTLSKNSCQGTLNYPTTACTMNVTFTPHAAGQRPGAVQITDGNGNVVTTTNIYGNGIAPQVAFLPAVQSVPATGLYQPWSAKVDGSGNLWIADYGNQRLVEVLANGTQKVTALGFNPEAIALDGAGDVFLSDLNFRVVEIPAGGGAQKTIATGITPSAGLAVDVQGNIYLPAVQPAGLIKIAPDGSQTTLLEFNNVRGVVVDSTGNIFAGTSDSVIRLAPGGSTTVVASGFSNPSDLALDAAGDLYVADYGNSRVVRVTPDGTQTVAYQSNNAVGGLTIDPSGNLFVVDTYNNRVVEVQYASPIPLTFAATNVGSTSASQSFTISNNGNAPLTNSALTVGTNFAQVPGAGQSSDCTAGFSLLPGASCSLALAFAPTAAGTLQSTAVLTDNSLNGNPATQTINLSGTATLVSQTITFGPISAQTAGATVSLGASASSGLPVSFTSLTPAICTVSGASVNAIAAGTCSIQATQSGNAEYAAATPITQPFAITSASGFTITPTPASETIKRGVLAAYLLQLKSVNGFSGKVNLSCSGGPTASLCVDFPQTVQLKGTALALTGILFPANTAPGTYTVTFIGTSGTVSSTATAKFTVK